MDWINVKDGLPKVNYDQLLFLSSGSISTGYLSKRKPKIQWTIHNEEEQDAFVTHWMQLPKEPKKGDMM